MSMPGRMIVVVGPSGAGKDSLIDAAKLRFGDHERVKFVRRTITRECDPDSEVHDSVEQAAFDQMQKDGQFAVHWEAHGLLYGIPLETLDQMDAGSVLIANGSRRALGLFQTAYAQLTIVNVTARPEVLAERLAARGREDASAIRNRLQREAGCEIEMSDAVDIDNSGALEVAARQFTTLIEAAL